MLKKLVCSGNDYCVPLGWGRGSGNPLYGYSPISYGLTGKNGVTYGICLCHFSGCSQNVRLQLQRLK